MRKEIERQVLEKTILMPWIIKLREIIKHFKIKSYEKKTCIYLYIQYISTIYLYVCVDSTYKTFYKGN